LKNQRDQIEISLEYLRKDVARNQSEFDIFTEKKNARIATHRKEIELTQNKLDTLVLPVFKRMDNYSEAKAKLEERTKNNESRLAVLNNNLNRDKKDMDALSKMMNCPTCQKPFDDVHTKKEKIESFKTSIALLEAEKVILLDQQTKLREQAQKARTYEEKVREEEAVIRNRTSLETSIQTITETISDVEKDTNPFGDIVSSKQKEFDEKFIEFENIKKDCKIYEVLKYVYSPEGVKNHIIKRIINLFNDILRNYLIELNSPFRLSFDEYFEETIVHDGDEVAYGTMSRGEKARVMLAIVFTFRELRRLQTGLSVDTTFYDEIFDIGLCKHGMERCLEILEKQQKSFVITHRSQNIDTSRYARISLVKKNGLTSLFKEV
jgi:hypothetical protein